MIELNTDKASDQQAFKIRRIAGSLILAAYILFVEIFDVASGLTALLLIPVWALYVLIRRKSFPSAYSRKLKIIGFTVICTMISVVLQNNMATRNGQLVVDALEQFRSEQGVYPKKLEDMVPKFLEEVPRAKFATGTKFYYYNRGEGKPPTLFYAVHFPGREGYDFENKRWYGFD